MDNNAAIALKKAGIFHELYWLKGEKRVFVTKANQLIGEHKTLHAFRKEHANYKGWESHHIVERQDIKRLGLQHLMPNENRQVCVLLPYSAHQKRVNSILRHFVPTGTLPTKHSLKEAYQDAYDLIGNYCGSCEFKIREELMALFCSILNTPAS